MLPNDARLAIQFALTQFSTLFFLFFLPGSTVFPIAFPLSLSLDWVPSRLLLRTVHVVSKADRLLPVLSRCFFIVWLLFRWWYLEMKREILSRLSGHSSYGENIIYRTPEIAKSVPVGFSSGNLGISVLQMSWTSKSPRGCWGFGESGGSDELRDLWYRQICEGL